jgi:hypothetical protein
MGHNAAYGSAEVAAHFHRVVNLTAAAAAAGA